MILSSLLAGALAASTPTLPLAEREHLTRTEFLELLSSAPRAQFGPVESVQGLTGAWLMVPGLDFVKVLHVEADRGASQFHGICHVVGVTPTGDYVELGAPAADPIGAFTAATPVESDCVPNLHIGRAEFFISLRGEVLIRELSGEDVEGKPVKVRKDIGARSATAAFLSAMTALRTTLGQTPIPEDGDPDDVPPAPTGICNWVLDSAGAKNWCAPDEDCRNAHEGICWVTAAAGACNCVSTRPNPIPDDAQCFLTPGNSCEPNFKCALDSTAKPRCIYSPPPAAVQCKCDV